MKANELRIGNWVKIKDKIFEDGWETGYDIYKTNEFQITGFNDGSSMKGCKVICFYEIPGKAFGGFIHSGCRDIDIDPIRLTEEWLEKFSFEFDQDYGMFGFFNKHHVVYKCDDGSFEFHPFCTNDKDCHIKLEYVHQLQNLCFALTGEELTLKSR